MWVEFGCPILHNSLPNYTGKVVQVSKQWSDGYRDLFIEQAEETRLAAPRPSVKLALQGYLSHRSTGLTKAPK